MAGADAWLPIFELNADEERGFCDMKNPISALCKHNHLLPRLLQELAAPVLPAHRLPTHSLALALQPIVGGQGKHQQGEQDTHPHRSLGYLQGMAQVLLLLSRFDAAVLDEAVVIIVSKGLQRLGDRRVGQEYAFAPGP
jgi:hypothetical protein